MAEAVSLLLAIAALLAAVVALPGFALVRWTVMFAALAGGQIYLTVVALVAMLVVENRFAIRFCLPRSVNFFLGISLVAIIALTLFSPVNLRTLAEFVQLVLYLSLFFMLASFLRSGREIQLVLKAAVLGTVTTAFLGLALNTLGYTTTENFFIGRGLNEGAAFLSLIGVVSSVVMFARSRNPMYLAAAIFLGYLQLLATSRGTTAVTAVVILVGLFFQFRNPLIRAAMVAAGAFMVFQSVPALQNLVEGQMNFSAKERFALTEHGWHISWDRFWTGHGWGSTDSLAAAAPTTRNIYPHFHNTYIQMIVELGLFGWMLLAAFLYFAIHASVVATLKIRQRAVSTLVLSGFLAILIAGNFDALLFGADRSVQVIILCALIARSVMLGQEHRSANRGTPAASSGQRLIAKPAAPTAGMSG